MKFSFFFIAFFGASGLATDAVSELNGSLKYYESIPKGVARYLSDPKMEEESLGLGLPGVIHMEQVQRFLTPGPQQMGLGWGWVMRRRPNPVPGWGLG